MAGRIKILETFRDSIQGLTTFVSTEDKVGIINTLFEVGFDYVDAGSFVNPEIIPQFADMDRVLEQIHKGGRHTKLFMLVANYAGAEKAAGTACVDVLGFPFSTSPAFLQKNIHVVPEEAYNTIRDIQLMCLQKGKELMVYLAMAFGNPYGDPVGVDICLDATKKFYELGIRKIQLSDITGVSTPAQIGTYYQILTAAYPDVEFGLHLHIGKPDWMAKLVSAFKNGCLTFDGVISGLGGCPMTGYEMLQNLSTTYILEFAREQHLEHRVDLNRFQHARENALLALSPYL